MAEGDNEDEVVQPRDPGYEGVFSTITLEPALFEVAGGKDESGNPVTRRSAEDLRGKIVDQLWAMVEEQGGLEQAAPRERRQYKDEVKVIAEQIVRWMPRGAMYDKVVDNLDLRPFLAAWQKANPDSDGGQVAEWALAGEQASIAEAYAAANENNSVSTRVDSGTIDAAAAAQTEFSPSVAGLRPGATIEKVDAQLDAAVASGEITAEQAQQELYEDDPMSAFDDDPGATIAFPVDELYNSVFVGQVKNIMELADQEASWVQQQLEMGAAVDPSTAFTPIDLGMRTVDGGGGVPGEMRPQRQVMNAVDAMLYLQKLKPSELEKLQQSLARAGYMANDQGLTYEPGDQTDELTMIAWQRALFDSVREKTPMPKLLVDRSAEQDKLREEQRAISNEDLFRNGVNAIVRDVLGRDMTNVEYGQVRGYIMQTIAQRAEQIPGEDERTWEGTTYDNELYGETEINAAIEDTMSQQLDRYGAMASYTQLDRAFGGGGVLEFMQKARATPAPDTQEN